MKSYNGRIPACGVFCGGCPIYTREKSPCKGAEQNGLWGIERSGFFNGREKWAKGFENQRV